MVLSVWTDQETKDYLAIRNPRLEHVYRRGGFSQYNPEARAQFLIKDVLKLGRMSTYLIERGAKICGRNAVMQSLERMAVNKLTVNKNL